MTDLSPTAHDAPWLSPEQREFRAGVARFAANELRDDPQALRARDRASEFWRQGWEACGRFGIQGLPIPEQWGGGGAGPLTTILALEALGWGCTDGGLLFSIGAHMWSSEVPMWHFGTDAQRADWLPRLCDGRAVGIHAITEPEAGSDAFSLTTKAVKEGDTYVLTGRKTFITNAPVADLLIVFARLGEGTGPFGITAFIVPPDASGLEITRLDKMGLRTSPMGELALDGVRVPSANLLGREGKGARIFQTSMEWERACIMATTVGAMQRVTEQTIAYAKERRQFGQPIGKFEAVAFKAADMVIRLHAARGLLYRTGAVMESGEAFTAQAAEAKVFISEAAVQTHLDALQIHGGAGYITETGLERGVRDALGGTIYSGTSEIQRRIIARSLGLG